MTAAMLGASPENVLLVGIVGKCYEPGEPLSAAVRESLAPAIDAVLQELQSLGFTFHKKATADEPGIWWSEVNVQSLSPRSGRSHPVADH